jgi:predicted hydrocarbon binding protein
LLFTLTKDGVLSEKTDFPVTTGNDSKVVLMRQEALQTMEQAIRRTFSSGADVIFYDQGQAMGKLLGDSLIQKLGVDFLRNNPIELFSFYQSFGWCKFQVKTWDQEKGRAELIAHENSECVGLRSDKPTGHMIRGHLCGLIEAVWGTKVKTTETECASMGHEACKYSIVTA